MTSATAQELFDKVTQVMPLAEVASRLSLHANTIKRWGGHGQGPRALHGGFQADVGAFRRGRGSVLHQTTRRRQCWETFRQVAQDLHEDLSPYTFIEPSAG